MLRKLGVTTKPTFYSFGENKYMAAVANGDNSSVDRSDDARFLESVHKTNKCYNRRRTKHHQVPRALSLPVTNK